MDLTITRTIRGPAVPPLHPERPNQPYYHVQTCKAVLKNGVWQWEQISRELAHIDTTRSWDGMPPDGTVRGHSVTWHEIRHIALAWAWNCETVQALVAAIDKQERVAPILADALQNCGLAEGCPLLSILRSWE